MTPEIFCCHPFKNGWKLAVLLLFSNFSASFSLLLAVPRYKKWRKTSGFAIFKLFALLFSNFDKFHFFQFFLKKNKKKLKKSEIFWKIVTPGIFCCHPFKNGWKLAVLLLFSNFSASFSLLLAVPRWKTSCFAAIFKLFALLFSNCDEFQIFEKNWNFLKNLWI